MRESESWSLSRHREECDFEKASHASRECLAREFLDESRCLQGAGPRAVARKGVSSDGLALAEAGMDAKPQSEMESRRAVSEMAVLRRQLETATQSICEGAERRFGKEKIADLKISKDDLGFATAAIMLGPDLCRLLGRSQSRLFGKQLLIFGFAPIFGITEEAKKKMAENPGALIHEGSGNFIVGAAVGAVLERAHPAILLAALTGGGALLLNDELNSPEHQARNRELLEINRRLEGCSQEELLYFAGRAKSMLGPAFYKAAFDLTTAGPGLPEGALGASLARNEVRGLAKTLDLQQVRTNIEGFGKDLWRTFSSLLSGEQRQICFAAAGGRGGAHFLSSAAETERNSVNVLKMEGKPPVHAELGQPLEGSASKLDKPPSSITDTTKPLPKGELSERTAVMRSLLELKKTCPELEFDREFLMNCRSESALEEYRNAVLNTSFLLTNPPPEYSARDLKRLIGSIESRMKDLSEAFRAGSSNEALEPLTKKLESANDFISELRKLAEIKLKPGIHEMTFARVAREFSTNDVRRELFKGLRQLAYDLKEAGCDTLYLDGSFITGKPFPADFDACWEPVKGKLKKGIFHGETESENAARRAKYLGDVFPRYSDEFGDRVKHWQYDERNGVRKGIIMIDLRSLP